MASSGPQRPYWFARNSDLIAATFIVIFAGIGTAATSWIDSAQPRVRNWIVEPAVESVRPHVTQIRTESREAAAQLREELLRARHEVRGEFCEMSGDLRQAKLEGVRFREDLRRLRSEIREELRNWFRRSDWR